MKKTGRLMMILLMLGLTACGSTDTKPQTSGESQKKQQETVREEVSKNPLKIELSNDRILADGEELTSDPEAAVYQANDIIFYLEGQGMEYGEGTPEDEHSQAEADSHRVVHITRPGTYEISGTMEAGQIFVDLGENAKNDPNAVVNLILNNANLTCKVAPAILFYRVYECGDVKPENTLKEVDMSGAGANLIIADGSHNEIYGSYVAKIYKSSELNENGTKVLKSKKLHKYDGAVHSRASMNIYGDTGSLKVTAENEGISSEVHLMLHGGNLTINSGNDGINVNEEEVSVFTMNGGTLDVRVTGETGEGDGIDSNGWIVINGGELRLSACGTSRDSGLDSDEGTYLNGGHIAASGNKLDEISDGKQAYGIFECKERQEGGKTYEVRDEQQEVLMEVTPANAFTMLVVSSETMNTAGTCSLWLDGKQIEEIR